MLKWLSIRFPISLLMQRLAEQPIRWIFTGDSMCSVGLIATNKHWLVQDKKELKWGHKQLPKAWQPTVNQVCQKPNMNNTSLVLTIEINQDTGLHYIKPCWTTKTIV